MPFEDDALLDDGVEVAELAPLVDDLLESAGAGLEAAGGLDGVVLVLGFDWAIAPDSAKALSATPIMSLFNILASKR